MMTSKGPDALQHLIDRASVLDSLTPSERRALNELQGVVQKNIDVVSAKQDFVTSEANQYERQYTSFFALAISFIIAGLLSSPPSISSTNATKVLYFATIVAAAAAAIFLFFEYVFVSRLYGKWTKANSDILEYINNGNWRSPTDMSNWMSKRQAKVPQRSTRAVIVIEIILVTSSFLFLGAWLFETLFNPDWPFF